MQWIIDNIGDLIEIATMIVAIASVIATMTPTPKDDGIAKKLTDILNFLALNFGKAKNAQVYSQSPIRNSESNPAQASKK